MDATEHQLTAALYGRVSRLDPDRDDKADRERSVTQQLSANEKACARYGWTISARYADPGRSASRFATRARENWQHVLAAVKARQFSVLVLWETSRASRDPEEWLPLLAECRRAGIRITSPATTSGTTCPSPSIGRGWRAMAFTTPTPARRRRCG